MFVDLRMANLMAEQKREELARSYRSPRRRPKRAESGAADERFSSRPVVRRLLLGR